MQLKQPKKRTGGPSVQRRKSSFRSSARWKRFRKTLGEKSGVDFVTGKPLSAGWQCHHLDPDPSRYEDLSDPSKFVCLDRQTHVFVHWLWEAYSQDPDVLDRLAHLLSETERLSASKNREGT